MFTLGIESSCDDTAAAVLKDDKLLANILSSQDSIHSLFGGVVPELASRQHLRAICPVVNSALNVAGITLDDIDLIAATQGPGLIGSLLVGFSYAKTLSHVKQIPFVGVNHMAGHIFSVFLNKQKPQFPYIALIVSGGSSSIFLVENFFDYYLLGRTRDDAAGEAFDKTAKLLNLPYPGGPHISRSAKEGDPGFIKFPRAWLGDNSLDFSFSGLKTAVLNHVNQCKQKGTEIEVSNICASFQEAVVDVLVEKTLKAAERHGITTIILGGGVSANIRLQRFFKQRCQEKKFLLYIPQKEFCTDNAAMIALAGYQTSSNGCENILDLDVYSRANYRQIDIL